MTARAVASSGDRLITEDGDGVTREWDAVTYRHIATAGDPR